MTTTHSTHALLGMLATAIVVCLSPGCIRTPGDGADAGAEEPDVPYVEPTCTPDADDTFCPEYAAEYCRAHFACCDDPTLQYGSMGLCVQRTTCDCTARREGASFDDGRVVFVESAADALLERLRDAAGGSCPLLDPSMVQLDTAFAGTVETGGDCSPSGTDYSSLFSCAPGHYCYVTELGDETAPPVADCRRYRAEGETCDIGMECALGHFCADGATIDDPGVCRPQLAAGATCDFDHECPSDWCDEELGTCRPTDVQDTYCVDPDDFEGDT